MFVCTVLGSEFSASEFGSITGEHGFVVDVGYDDQMDVSYKLHVGLAVVPGGGLEFFFLLQGVDDQNGHATDYWSGKETQFIDGASREAILDVVLTLTEKLLKNAPVDVRITYTTYDQYPPPQALDKHFRIVEIFNTCGYNVVTADPYHGKRVWWMERAPEVDVA